MLCSQWLPKVLTPRSSPGAELIYSSPCFLSLPSVSALATEKLCCAENEWLSWTLKKYVISLSAQTLGLVLECPLGHYPIVLCAVWSVLQHFCESEHVIGLHASHFTLPLLPAVINKHQWPSSTDIHTLTKTSGLLALKCNEWFAPCYKPVF